MTRPGAESASRAEARAGRSAPPTTDRPGRAAPGEHGCERRRPARRTAPVLAALALAAAWPAAARADGPPCWLPQVTAAAFGRAREPLEGDALDRARLEVRRASAAGVPQLRLGERASLAPDGTAGLTLELKTSVPLVAPSAAAERRLADVRLAETRRELSAQRRRDTRDALATAAGLLAAQRRARAISELGRASEALAGTQGPTQTRDAAPGPERTRLLVDVRLLLTQLEAQLRAVDDLRRELEAARALGEPAEGTRPEGTPALPCPAGRSPPHEPEAVPGPRGGPPAPPEPGTLAHALSALEPRGCVAGSDAVALATLAREEARWADAVQHARAAARVDLELNGAVHLGPSPPSAEYEARVALTVRLPPWSPVTAASSVAAGAAGLEQEASLSWPNRAPALPPGAAASLAAADRLSKTVAGVRRRLRQLEGQEADLLRRRAILAATRSQPAAATLPGAYLQATLALQLADVDEALALTRLDAAMLCGALPP